jgi:hypothetical protein
MATGGGLRHPGRQHRAGGPKLGRVATLSQLVAGAALAGRIGASERGRNLLFARCQHSQGGESVEGP